MHMSSISTGTCDNCAGMYPIREDGKWGFMNETGTPMVLPGYDLVSPCINGYIAVSNNGDWGIINNEGDVIIPLVYEIEWKDKCSVMTIERDDGMIALFYTKTGLLDDFKWRSVKIQEEKCEFPVQSSTGQWGYVDEVGNEFVACSFIGADFYNEGWAGVKIYDDENLRIEFDALINLSGAYLYPPDGYSIMCWDGVSEGLIQIQDETTGLFGYMNMEGKIVIPALFDNAYPFHGGFAVVEIFTLDESFFVDRTGKILDMAIHPPVEGDYSSISFSNNLITVFIEENNSSTCAVMDNKGTIRFINHNPEVAWIFHYYDDDHAWYVNEDGHYGIINKEGVLITPPVFGCINENGSPFCEGVAAVSYDGLWGFIDLNGLWEILPLYERAWSYNNGLALVSYEGALMYIDHEGNIIWAESR